MAPNEAGFHLLLRYAAAADHKLSVKHIALAAGIAPSTASTRLSSAKKTNTNAKISNAQLTAALPVLVKYGEAIGKPIVVKHFATAAGIAPSTASTRLTQAKNDIASDASQAGTGEAEPIANKSTTTRNARAARNSKKNENVQADSEATRATPESKPSRKRKFSAPDDKNVEADHETTKPKRCNLAVVINTYGPAVDSSGVKVEGNDRSESAKIDDGNQGIETAHMPTDEHEPPKKKRGRPPKKPKDDVSSSQANGKGNGEKFKSPTASPVSKDGTKAVNDEHAAAIDAAAISSERSLALDGTIDAHKLKRKDKFYKIEPQFSEVVYPVQTSANDTAGEMLDAVNFGEKTEETRSVSMDPCGTVPTIDAPAIEEDVYMRSPEGTHDSLMDLYIDIEKGEGASEAMAE